MGAFERKLSFLWAHFSENCLFMGAFQESGAQVLVCSPHVEPQRWLGVRASVQWQPYLSQLFWACSNWDSVSLARTVFFGAHFSENCLFMCAF